MTEDELKAEAKKLGYTVAKKPCYQCSCYMPYPNINHKNKSGKWKCIDRYEPIELERKWWHQPLTKCKRIEQKADGGTDNDKTKSVDDNVRDNQ